MTQRRVERRTLNANDEHVELSLVHDDAVHHVHLLLRERDHLTVLACLRMLLDLGHVGSAHRTGEAVLVLAQSEGAGLAEHVLALYRGHHLCFWLVIVTNGTFTK